MTVYAKFGSKAFKHLALLLSITVEAQGRTLWNKQQSLIHDIVLSKVENGATTIFWRDQWLQGSFLFNGFLLLSNRKMGSAEDLWRVDLAFWDLGLVWNLSY